MFLLILFSFLIIFVFTFIKKEFCPQFYKKKTKRKLQIFTLTEFFNNNKFVNNSNLFFLTISEKYILVGKLLKPGEQPTNYSDEDEDGPEKEKAATEKKDEWLSEQTVKQRWETTTTRWLLVDQGGTMLLHRQQIEFHFGDLFDYDWFSACYLN